MKILSNCDIMILAGEVKFILTNCKTQLEEFDFRLANSLNSKTKLIYKGYKKDSEGNLYIGLMNITNKIEDYKIRKGQFLGTVHE